MLLGEDDPYPVEIVTGHGNSGGLLLCEHAGARIPVSLALLGLQENNLKQHIAIDIGAEATARLIAQTLNATLLIQRYSRLVIDCNRPINAVDSIPEVSHGVPIPGNTGLSSLQRNERIDEVFKPLDSAIAEQLKQLQSPWAFSIHSFTPSLNDEQRPWDLGLLFREDAITSEKMAHYARTKYPELTIGLNQPYQIDSESDWFVPQHAERLGIPHSLIEIRNDHISSVAGQHKWSAIVSDLIQHAITDN